MHRYLTQYILVTTENSFHDYKQEQVLWSATNDPLKVYELKAWSPADGAVEK